MRFLDIDLERINTLKAGAANVAISSLNALHKLDFKKLSFSVII